MKLTSTSTRPYLAVAAAAVALTAPSAALARIPEGASNGSQAPPASDQVVVPCGTTVPVGFGGSNVTMTPSCAALPQRSSAIVVSPLRARRTRALLPIVDRFVHWAAVQDAFLAGQ